MVASFLQTHLNSHRFVAPFIISCFWKIFGAIRHVHVPGASTGGNTDTDTLFVSQLVQYPVVAKEPERAIQVSNDSDVPAPVRDHTGNEKRDIAPPQPAISVTDDSDPQGGNETVPTVTHDESRQFSLRKVRSHNDIKVGASLPA